MLVASREPKDLVKKGSGTLRQALIDLFIYYHLVIHVRLDDIIALILTVHRKEFLASKSGHTAPTPAPMVSSHIHPRISASGRRWIWQ